MMSPRPEPRAAVPFFRPEAVAEQESRWLGQVLIVPRLGQTLAVGLAVLLALGVLGLLAFGQYTRTERLSGWIVPAGMDPGIPSSRDEEAVETRLVAHLYGPREAIGDIRRGQRVQLRYDAVPQEQSGQYEGRVLWVAPAELTSGEVAQVTGNPALALAEPLFSVEVEIAPWTAADLPPGAGLLPTMTLEADVIIETRRVWEWVLDLEEARRGQARGGEGA